MSRLGEFFGKHLGCVRDVDLQARQVDVTIGLFTVALETQVGGFRGTVHLDRAGVRTLRHLLKQAQMQVNQQARLAKQAMREE